MPRERVLELWESFRAHAVPEGAEMVQLAETKKAFFAGAWALFLAINSIMSADREPTTADLKAMEEIDAELRRWQASF